MFLWKGTLLPKISPPPPPPTPNTYASNNHPQRVKICCHFCASWTILTAEHRHFTELEDTNR
ncbi:hypothetical protein SK128_016417 [Halocaridina rubra]|uniref:Uncharacterized protein n=1 Tax=Halocaridina rubra TaxID=373956 RepID=A0AAN8WRW6_HALRR